MNIITHATMVNEDMHRMFISIDKTMKCRAVRGKIHL